MGSLGSSEIILIGVIVLLLCLAPLLPKVGASIGKSLGVRKSRNPGPLVLLIACVALFVILWPLFSALYTVGDTYALSLLVGVLIAIPIFGGLGAWVASAKHRSNIEGGVLGGLLGPFGVIIEALLPSQSAPAPPTAVTASPELTRKCPDCAETIKAEARVCRFCGARFSDAEVGAALRRASAARG
jgi:hypothetical protein